MSEFAFELALCASLEADDRVDGLLARQLGGSVAAPGGRILDVVGVDPGTGFDDRTRLTPNTIPDLAIEADVGPGTFRYWKDAFESVDCHPDHARRVVDRAVEIGFFERKRRRGREYVRQVARYPDWVDRVVGIENKPDLGRPGDLEMQLRTDVSLALVDEAILATESYVTRAHLNRIPEEVGVWRVHRGGSRARGESAANAPPPVEEIEVIREPTPLPVEEPGVEPLNSHPGRTDVAVVPTDAKVRARRRLAERAYGKGWRTYAFPDCGACEARSASGVEIHPDDGATLPWCAWKDRIVDAESDCGPACPGHDPTEGPAVDLDAERDRRTPWVADPAGARRRQSGLDQF